MDRLAKPTLFEPHEKRIVRVGIQEYHDNPSYTEPDKPEQLFYRSLHVRDISSPGRRVDVSFDLEGRITSISFDQNGFSYPSEVKLLDRHFNGNLFTFPRNYDSLQESHLFPNSRFNTISGHDDKMAKFLIDSVYLWLHQLSNSHFQTNDQISYIDLWSGILSKNPPTISAPDEESVAILKKALAYDWGALVKNELFFKAYPTSVKVLPPDIRPDVNVTYAIIQNTTGCPKSKKCGFCTSFSGIEYREKSLDELAKHIELVKEFHGAGWKYVNKLMLSDGDPLLTRAVSSQDYLRTIAGLVPQAQAIQSFASTAAILSKPEEEWAALHDLGLDCIYWGVESADNATLERLHKHHTEKQIYDAVQKLDKMGLPYSIIVMSGVEVLNPEGLDNKHEELTIRFLKETHPKKIYVSKFVPIPGTVVIDIPVEKLDGLHEKLLSAAYEVVGRKQRQTIENSNVHGQYALQFV